MDPSRVHAGRLARALSLLALALAPVPAAAQAGGAAPPPEVTATLLEGRPPAIDGRLDEDAWRKAVPLTGFRQRQPREGQPASVNTEVYLLYDRDALYVGARMHSPGTPVQAPVSRRDDQAQSDYLLVSLDPYHDRLTAYTLGVTAAGTRLDWYHNVDSEGQVDRTFAPVWQARTRVDSAGWTAEMRIPFSQLRFNNTPSQVWGINVRRSVPALNEENYLVVVPRNQTGWSSRFATLRGIQGIAATRRLELLPYVVSNATVRSDPNPANPFSERSETGVRVGGDLKMGFGPNLTLDASINPDFGQVDADPAEVNLSAYETFFGERRPFFVEGAQLLAGSGPAYFYSRRIGAPPLLSPAADFSDVPEASTILGAAKLTGRLPSATSIGVLAAVTDHEHARTFVADGSVFGRTRVAPRSVFGVARVQQELGRGGSTVGAILTAVGRDLGGGDPEAGLLHDGAVSGGADWRLRFDRGTYQVSGWAGFSHVAGDSTALIRTQRSSAHYFQRPDAGHVSVDSQATSLSGYTGGLSIQKLAGRWQWEAFGQAYSPGFELRDAGRLRRADEAYGMLNLRYLETRPGRVFRDFEMGATGENRANFGGVRTLTGLRTDAYVTWKNFWSSSLSYRLDLPAQDDALTRGGPLMELGAAHTVSGSMATRPGAPVRWSASGRLTLGAFDEQTSRLTGGVTVRPAPRWRFVLSPEWFRSVYPRQYVQTRAGGRAETFGRRYIFSTIDFRTLSAPMRLSYMFTPDLTLEGYVEPFAASGRYYAFGELEAPRSRNLRVYGRDGTTAQRQPDGSLVVTDGAAPFTIGSPDFDVRSFRSNAVLRWEWRPGSTMYLVWQQSGENGDVRGRQIGFGALGESLETRGDNFLALKISYWLPVGGSRRPVALRPDPAAPPPR
jgi:hypothetical protein